jgi:nitroimidazol reductase NimA-like FMN-containing flavoprotein (pyridoxamine 5'-phosphate oxidase superfamily)
MLGELTASEVEQLLIEQVVARIGCHAEGTTYVVPITYVYHDGNIIGHSTDGLKLRMMRANPDVCVEIDQMSDLGNWRSVIAWGRFEELSAEQALAARHTLTHRLQPLIAIGSRPPTHGMEPKQVIGAIVYRITLHRKTGRFERN